METTGLGGTKSLALGPLPDPKLGPQEIHRWLQEMKWDNGRDRVGKYATKYKYNPDTREQFKLIVGEYCRMEEEKDERQYGSLLDSLARIEVAGRMSLRWAEVMKSVGTSLQVGEYAAVAGAALLVDTAESAEQRNGYLAQVMDECRHTVQAGYINRYFGKHCVDPAGQADANKVRWLYPFNRALARTIGECELSGDPVEVSMNLMMVAEACFTNPALVGLNEWAAANGDEVTPTIFLSIESDELRHMANGYHTVVSIMDNPDNMRYLQTDLENAFWIQHRFLTPFVGVVLEYFADNKVEPYVHIWNRWVYEDWASIWLGRFQKFGLKSPAPMAEAKQEAYWGHHWAGTAVHAIFPVDHYRTPQLTEREMEWFETNYPGWYNEVGEIWDIWKRDKLEDPANGKLTLIDFVGKCPLYNCRVCQVACFVPTPESGMAKMRIIEHGGRKHAFCSQWCERYFLQEPERFQGATFDEMFHGWELSEAVKALGGVRSDGKTLIGQPHLRADKLWTLEDIRRMGIVLRSPLIDD